jgi:hypothetical protein
MVLTLALGALNAVYAASARWSTNPISNDWNTAENWTPNTVPNGPDDIATFGLSHHTGVFVSTDTELNELIFSPGASPFTINAAVDQILTISGIGITNDSGVAQNFVFPTFEGVVLTNSATVGDMTFFTLKGGHGQKNNGGFAGFDDTASAGNGTFLLESPETPDANSGGGYSSLAIQVPVTAPLRFSLPATWTFGTIRRPLMVLLSSGVVCSSGRFLGA